MNNLRQRFFTSVIGASVLIAAMVWNIYSLIIILYLMSILVHFEFLQTTGKFKKRASGNQELVLNLLIGLLIFSIVPFMMLESIGILFSIVMIIPLLFVYFIYELFAGRENPFQNIGLNITGIFYCVIPFELLLSAPLLIGDFSIGPVTTPANAINTVDTRYFVLGYFLIIWTNDVMAYFTGRAIGKHKLFERISPKKTWEGFIGGFIFSIGAAAVISQYLNFLTLVEWISIAVIISVFGTLGDLVESMLKRSLQMKDSSNILPGHGGFLDRFDATLIAIPFVWLYLVIIYFF